MQVAHFLISNTFPEIISQVQDPSRLYISVRVSFYSSDEKHKLLNQIFKSKHNYTQLMR